MASNPRALFADGALNKGCLEGGVAQLLAGLDKPLARTALAISLAYSAVLVPHLANSPGWLICSVALGCALVGLSVIDIATQRLPNSITLPLLASGLVCSQVLELEPGIVERVVAAIVAYGLLWAVGETYYRLRGRLGLGMGDAKLFAAAATWVGPEGLPTVMMLAAVTALAVALILALTGRMTLNSRIAFGPFLAAAIWLVWLYGPVPLM